MQFAPSVTRTKVIQLDLLPAYRISDVKNLGVGDGGPFVMVQNLHTDVVGYNVFSAAGTRIFVGD
ncbi:MAG: hypothetical protein H8E15_16950 [Planctomycetes bacterium]|nr:hypothetical protein [Planctomycetota bacterium]